MALARKGRKQPTEAEARLWARLRNRQLLGFKFRRQHPIDRFIVDFFCEEVGLAVELDGDGHAFKLEADAQRTELLAQHGVRVMRFSNHAVLTEVESVTETIVDVLNFLSAPTRRGAVHENRS